MNTQQPTPREQLLKHFTWQIAACKKSLDAWAEKFSTRPLDAFKWADDVVYAAARMQVAAEMRASLESETCTIEHLQNKVAASVAQASRWAHNGSTSSSSNHVDRCTLAAQAEALEILRGHVKG